MAGVVLRAARPANSSRLHGWRPGFDTLLSPGRLQLLWRRGSSRSHRSLLSLLLPSRCYAPPNPASTVSEAIKATATTSAMCAFLRQFLLRGCLQIFCNIQFRDQRFSASGQQLETVKYVTTPGAPPDSRGLARGTGRAFGRAAPRLRGEPRSSPPNKLKGKS